MSSTNNFNELISSLDFEIIAFLEDFDDTSLLKLQILQSKIKSFVEKNNLEYSLDIKKSINEYIYDLKNEELSIHEKVHKIKLEINSKLNVLILEQQAAVNSSKRIKNGLYIVIAAILITLSLGVWCLFQSNHHVIPQEFEMTTESLESETEITHADTQINDKDLLLVPFLKNHQERNDISIENCRIISSKSSFVQGFPVYTFIISNKSESAVTIISTHLEIVSAEELLSEGNTREVLPNMEYSVELKQTKGSYLVNGPNPLIIQPNDVGSISILFFSKLKGNYIEPYKIAKFVFRLMLMTDESSIILTTDLITI